MSTSSPQSPTRIAVAVIGGGQAGLAISWHLKQAGVEHVVFERRRIAHEWREARWDSFCLVTPNWQCRLPGFPYPGNDPHGFMLKHEIVQYLDDYVASFQPPVVEGVEVLRVRRNQRGLFEIHASLGDYVAEQVVIATGGYHVPIIPRGAERLPPHIAQLHPSIYRNAEALPPGPVLVVGTGQSGAQIAEDLHLAGREVHLCVGSAPRSPRFYRGKDVTDWLTESGYYDLTLEQHPQKETVQEKTNHYFTGRGGGREIDLRRFALDGMQLYGRFKGVEDTRLLFESDLAQNLDAADASYIGIRNKIDAYIAERGIIAPVEAPYTPAWSPQRETPELDYAAAGIAAVIWSIGFSRDYRWLEAPAFDGRGAPVQQRGVSPVPGLYFLGLPWMNTWGSGRFSDVGKDAEYLWTQIERSLSGAVAAAA